MRMTHDRESLLTQGERRFIFRSMLLFKLAVITLIFCIICWIISAAFGPIDFSDRRPIAFWLIPTGIFAIGYYSYALFTEMSDNTDADRVWRLVAATVLLAPLVVYFTVAGMMFLFFTVSEVDVGFGSLPLGGGS